METQCSHMTLESKIDMLNEFVDKELGDFVRVKIRAENTTTFIQILKYIDDEVWLNS